MKDQYGDNVPDLARLNVTVKDIEGENCDCLYSSVYAAEWYEYMGEIYIPLIVANLLDEVFGIEVDINNLLLNEDDRLIIPLWIPAILKRFDYDGLGFYHA